MEKNYYSSPLLLSFKLIGLITKRLDLSRKEAIYTIVPRNNEDSR